MKTHVQFATTAACTVLTCSAFAADETLIVNTLNDVSDVGSSATVDELPGPDGLISMREAVTAANNSAGGQTIEFAIPEDEWWLYDDLALVRIDNGSFVIDDDGTFIDFSSQANLTGDTNPDGCEVGLYGSVGNSSGSAAIYIHADNCTVKGLGIVHNRGYGMEINGNFNRVIGCDISGPLYAGVNVRGWAGSVEPTGNVIGGTAPGEGNTLSSGNAGVRIDGASFDTVVVGNTLRGSVAGVQVRGAYFSEAEQPRNTRIGGPTDAERNVIAGSGYFGEHQSRNGKLVQIEWANDTLIEGNYIGTNAAGTAAEPQIAPVGLSVRAANNTTIRNNVISGIDGTGVHIYDESIDAVLVGNKIGTDKSGLQPIPNWTGVQIGCFLPGDCPGGTFQIGGVDPGEGNLIAHNLGDGVFIGFGAIGVSIIRNAIYNNDGLEIELASQSGADGVTPNDPGDGDNGGNNLQNKPVLTSAEADQSQVTIAGSFNSVANENYTIELYASSGCDDIGSGETERYLGDVFVGADEAGDATFEVTIDALVEAGEFITATATRESTGDTSEVAQCLPVQTQFEFAPGDVNLDGVVDTFDLLPLLDSWGACDSTPECPADLNNDDVVDTFDLLILIENWS